MTASSDPGNLLKRKETETGFSGCWKKEKKKGKTLGRKRLFPLLLTPLMSGKVPVAERICRGLELLRSEEAGIDKETRQKMETILYALAVKLLDAKALEQVKGEDGYDVIRRNVG